MACGGWSGVCAVDLYEYHVTEIGSSKLEFENFDCNPIVECELIVTLRLFIDVQFAYFFERKHWYKGETKYN